MCAEITEADHSQDIDPDRRLPVGAECQRSGGVHFRVWAPRCQAVSVRIEGFEPVLLEAEAGGYFSGLVPEAGSGTRYRFCLDGETPGAPDPASRFQPEGPHGPSEVVDPSSFCWTDGEWQGRPREELVLYEMHVGTFTAEGTWEAATEQLPALAELGITCIEVMPVADFPGDLVGAMTALTFSHPPAYMATRTISVVSSTAPTDLAYASFWMSSIITSAPTAIT